MFVHSGIGPLLPAVAENDDAGVACNHEVEFDMPMSEDVIIVVVAELLLLLGEEDKFLGVLAFVGARVRHFFHTAAACPFVAKAVAEGRGNEAEERLRDWVMEEGAQAYEVAYLLADGRGERLQVAGGYDAIAVCEVERFAMDNGGEGRAVDDDSRLACQPPESPYIVVADEIVHLYAAVCQALEGSEERTVCLFARVAPEILVPEVEHVAQQVDARGVLSHSAQQCHQAGLVFVGVRYGKGTEMGVRQEINHRPPQPRLPLPPQRGGFSQLHNIKTLIITN